jgi:hypothetical protein
VSGPGRRALLLVNTARHLRWEQWAYRAVRSLQAVLPAAAPRAPSATLAAGAAARFAEEVAAWGPPGGADGVLARAEEVAAGRFRFLGHVEVLDPVPWRRRLVSHLWSYNLHYFDYAPDLARAWRASGDARFAGAFRRLVEGWMEGAPAGRGDGWEPYALSLRVVNWAYALALFGDGLDAPFRARVEESLAAQAAFLERRLELHILANHLQKNLKALLVCGLLFEGPAARRWREAAGARLWSELEEQVLDDGGHFERSPMYHDIALADFLESILLLRALGHPVPARGEARVRRMAAAAGVLSRPDGALHLFNDAAQDGAPPRRWLDHLARRAFGEGIAEPEGAFALERTGYYGWADPAAGERVLIDCGLPGPEYQPGHAHCDLLSFELDLAGVPVVVDSGTSGYGGDPFRAYARSTRAHSTVQIGEAEQSEMWGDFRVARRARPLRAEHSAVGDAYRFSGACAHFGGGVHRREVAREGPGAWRVTDRVETRGARLRSYVHLHPGFAVEGVEGGVVRARAGGVLVEVEAFGADHVLVRRGELQPLQGWHLPEFGAARPAPVLELGVDDNQGLPFGYRIRTLGGE